MPNRPEMAAPTSGMTMVIMFTRVVSIDANVTPYCRGTVLISSSNRMRSTPAEKNEATVARTATTTSRSVSDRAAG